MLQYIEKLPIVAVEESSAEEKDGTSATSNVYVLPSKSATIYNLLKGFMYYFDYIIDAPMDVEAAAAAAMEALQPPPVPPSTVFPEVEVAPRKQTT